MREPRIGFIGAGKIASDHARAAIGEGLRLALVLSPNRSPIAMQTAKSFDAKVVTTVEEYVETASTLGVEAHAFLTPPHQTLAVLNSLVPQISGPILVEKPGIMDPLLRLPFDTSRLVVNYNRRLYSNVIEVREAIKTDGSLGAHAKYGESMAAGWDYADLEYVLRTNTVHLIDLALFLFGPRPQVRGSTFNRSGDSAVVRTELSYSNSSVFLEIGINLPIKATFESVVASRIFRLEPLENLTVFEGIEKKSPTDLGGISIYSPIVTSVLGADLRFIDGRVVKPGFKESWELIHARVSAERSRFEGIAASWEDALEAQVVVNQMLNQITDT